MNRLLSDAIDRIGPKYVLRIDKLLVSVSLPHSTYYCAQARSISKPYFEYEIHVLARDLHDLSMKHQACVLTALYAADAIREAEGK